MESIRIPDKPDDEPDTTHEEHQKIDKRRKHSRARREVRKELFSTLAILILAPIIAIILTVFVFQSYQVDGPSMESTLHNNDRLIVTKLGKTWSEITGGEYIPKRFSIIIFNYNGQSGFDVANKQLVKRVIGLPGDHIVIKDGVVTVYNSEHPQGFYPDKVGPEASVITNTRGELDRTLGSDEIFVMGDNRDNSLDSREFGPIRSEDIVGTLRLRIYPFGAIREF
ncbi:MAG TPA: signal peptidase I [Candidatus Saccharimonadales bacterium]|nr:signal peptidase I [Candidatus Saccharimonadales bacterium]